MLLNLLTIILSLYSSEIPAQHNFDDLPNTWTQGIVVDNTKVDPPKPYRGGWTMLTISEDGKLKFADPFSCGFGAYKVGTWRLDKANNEVTFNFDRLIGEMNNKKNVEINETFTFEIIHLDASNLILKEKGNPKGSSLGYLIMP